ncbi:MAG: inositol monophosphatase family protein [Planktomarina sp.]
MQISFDELEKAALAAADAADIETLRYFRKTDLTSDNKDAAGFDPVTIADRAAERAMRTVLQDLRPDDSIMGEEEGDVVGTSGLTWVLDPIDGTRGYISGTPTWGTLIAVGPQSGPVVGLIGQPYTGERFVGTPDGAYLQRGGTRTPLQTRTGTGFADATIFTTFPEVGTDQDRAGFDAVAKRCKLTRYGMDCYAYALLAAGQIDLVIEAGLHAYDIQGPMAVVQAAGGVVTSWSGGPAHNGGQVIAVANASIHAAALDILGPYANG